MDQLHQLHSRFDTLQNKHGANTLQSIYGAGKIHNPNLMFVFMNPTGRNVASLPAWKGLRAPWIGTKHIWSMFTELGLISPEIFTQITSKKGFDWDCNFAEVVYKSLHENSVYVTNLAKCTQIDARPLNNSVYKDYLSLMFEEIDFIKPRRVITFGNQVSSIILNMQISVSKYEFDDFEELLIGSSRYSVYPTFYPVGQGRRNQPLAVSRIKFIMKT